MSSLHSLPSELIGLIATALVESEASPAAGVLSRREGGSTHRDEARTSRLLAPLLLVNRGISATCSPLFWKSVRLAKKRTASLNFFIVDIAPRHASCIRCISVPSVAFLALDFLLARYPDGGFGHRSILLDMHDYYSALATAIRCCHNLKDLSLDSRNDSTMALTSPFVDALPSFDVSMGPVLSALNAVQLLGYGTWVASEGAAVLHSLPQLRTFSITIDACWSEPDNVAMLFAAIGQHKNLVSLEFGLVSHAPGDWLRLHAETEVQPWACALESFVFNDPWAQPHGEVLPLMTTHFWETLREAEISLHNLAWESQGVHDGVCLPNLERLIVRFKSGTSDTAPAIHPLLAFAKCDRLRTLGVDPLTFRTTLIDRLEATDVSGTPTIWPRLRLFDYSDFFGPRSSQLWGESHFERFADALRRRRPVKIWYRGACPG